MLCCSGRAGPEQAVTEGVSLSDGTTTGSTGTPTGYTALPSSEMAAETATAENARQARTAQLQHLQNTTPEPEPGILISAQVAAGSTEGGPAIGGSTSSTNKSSIGFQMDANMAEALGFAPAGASISNDEQT